MRRLDVCAGSSPPSRRPSCRRLKLRSSRTYPRWRAIRDGAGSCAPDLPGVPLKPGASEQEGRNAPSCGEGPDPMPVARRGTAEGLAARGRGTPGLTAFRMNAHSHDPASSTVCMRRWNWRGPIQAGNWAMSKPSDRHAARKAGRGPSAQSHGSPSRLAHHQVMRQLATDPPLKPPATERGAACVLRVRDAP